MNATGSPDLHPPFNPDDPLLLLCRKLSRQMDLFDDAAAAALDVGRSDLRALNLLEHGPLSPATIADHLGLTRAAVTALVDRLVARHLVVRAASSTDRRTIQVELLPGTWTAFARVYRPLGARVSEAVGLLPSNEQEALLAGLHALDTAFAEARDLLQEPHPSPDGEPGA